MRYAVLSVAALLVAGLAPAGAQQPIEVHPNQPAGGGLEISIPPINNPNYLDYGPLPDNPGADKSQDYMEQAGGNYENLSGPGSDVDADVMPDSDGAYESPLD
ncbi:hypothetical protein [Ancylobacter sp. FA202]|uniref:hypothetical protein n=1 Tax=Ancylobacter sp. FA202 TaxID=1111106 RepID=UPI00035EF3FD|nr:hypothetical protein [Ancylobacter sp. FA202]